MPKGMKNMRTLLLMIFAALSLSVSAPVSYTHLTLPTIA